MGIGDEMARVTGLFKSSEGVNNLSTTGFECTSVTNQKLLKLEKTSLEAYCRRSFLRVYPVGTEVASGNYDPVPGLLRGAQLVCLNTQTRDENAWMLRSYFTANGDQDPTRIGYVVKPSWLRGEGGRNGNLRRIEISVLSEYFEVKVRLLGSPEDRRRNQRSEFSFTVQDYC